MSDQGAGPGEAPGAGGPAPRRRGHHHRVVALSEADRRRLAAGELTSAVDALHQGDAPPVTPSAEPQQGTGENDARLLRDVPPHWGKR
ncbi:hypothetical protein [Georgenia ruanii]|uniref:hypothetical protein n=1 Tax=Georgenia ruanii TaxID=348442 RepID=UPI001D01461E|nr:hypothetical protein [Georgenia ruanii]